MEYTHLGRTGLTVSRLCLGTMNFGPQTTEADSHAIMDAAHEHGINFFDTANTYGPREGKGRTEEIVGAYFARGNGRREKTVLATKLYGDMGDWPNQGKLSALNIRRALDASLTRLQTDYIDLYQFHHIDRNTPWDEIWQALEVAVAQGKVLYVGSSNFAGWHIADAQAAARPAQLHRAGQRAVDLQPADPRRRTRSPAGGSGIRSRCHPLVTAARWPARRGAAQGARRRASDPGPLSRTGRRAPRPDRAVRGFRGRTRPRARRCRTGLAAAPARGDGADHRAAHHGAADCRHPGPRRHSRRQGVVDRLDEIFPGRKTAPEDYAW